MKYIIKESKLSNFVDKFLMDTAGRLRKFPIIHINAREDDFELVQNNGKTIFVYSDYHLGVDKKLFDKIMDLFNLDTKGTEKVFENWFKKNYPNDLVINTYPIIEY